MRIMSTMHAFISQDQDTFGTHPNLLLDLSSVLFIFIWCVCDANAGTYVYTSERNTLQRSWLSTRAAYVTVDCQPLFPGRSFSVRLSPSQTGHRCATRSLHIARCTRESAPASFRMIITMAIIGCLLSPRSTCQSAGENKIVAFYLDWKD